MFRLGMYKKDDSQDHLDHLKDLIIIARNLKSEKEKKSVVHTTWKWFRGLTSAEKADCLLYLMAQVVEKA